MIKIYCCLPSYLGYSHADFLLDLVTKARRYSDVDLVIRSWKRNKIDMNLNMSVHEFLFDPKYEKYDYWVTVSQDLLMPANFVEYPLRHPTADVIFGWTIFGYPPYFPTIGRMTYHPEKEYWNGQFTVKYLYAGIPFWCDDKYIPKEGVVKNDLIGFSGGMFIKRSALYAMTINRDEPFKFPIEYTTFPCKFMTEDGYFVQQMIADGCWNWVFDYSYKINHLSNPLFPRDLQNLRNAYSAQILNLFEQEAHDKVCDYFGWRKMPSKEELEKIYTEVGLREPH